MGSRLAAWADTFRGIRVGQMSRCATCRRAIDIRRPFLHIVYAPSRRRWWRGIDIRQQMLYCWYVRRMARYDHPYGAAPCGNMRRAQSMLIEKTTYGVCGIVHHVRNTFMEKTMPETNANISIDDVIDHPDRYGFVWLENQKVEKDGMVLTPVPLVKHNDLAKLTATFGDGLVLAAMDGTSRHVTNQRIVRDAKWANRSIDQRSLKRLIVENMLGQKAARKVRVVEVIKKTFAGMDGQEYDTFEQMQAANLAWFVDQQQTRDLQK